MQGCSGLQGQGPGCARQGCSGLRGQGLARQGCRPRRCTHTCTHPLPSTCPSPSRLHPRSSTCLSCPPHPTPCASSPHPPQAVHAERMAELQARHEATLSALSSQQAADSEAATWRLAAAEASAATARQQVEDMAAMYAEGNSMRGEDQARLRAQLRDLEVRVGGQSSSGRGSWILSQIMDPG